MASNNTTACENSQIMNLHLTPKFDGALQLVKEWLKLELVCNLHGITELHLITEFDGVLELVKEWL